MQQDYYNNTAKEGKAAKSGDRQWYTLYLALALIVVSALIYASNKWTDNQPISYISVQGNSIVSDTEITSGIVTPVINSRNYKISLQQIYDEIKYNPFISSSFVTHSGANQINIQIEERQPQALIVSADGSLGFTDANGASMPYRLLPQTRDIPLIRNINPASDSSASNGALAILNELLKEDYDLIYVTTSEIVYNPANKSYSIISTDNGIRIMLGRLDNLDQKLSSLLSFWKNIVPHEGTSNIKYIDLRWSNQVIVSAS